MSLVGFTFESLVGLLAGLVLTFLDFVDLLVLTVLFVLVSLGLEEH
jgi:hypothetical protein